MTMPCDACDKEYDPEEGLRCEKCGEEVCPDCQSGGENELCVRCEEETTRTQHTPLPWKVDAEPGLPVYIYAQQGLPGSIPPLRIRVAEICSLEDGEHNEEKRAECLANAALVIRACNCHDELAAALKKATSAIIVAQAHGFDCCGLLEEVEAALAKASAWVPC